MATYDVRYDLNHDGRVTLADAILMLNNGANLSQLANWASHYLGKMSSTFTTQIPATATYDATFVIPTEPNSGSDRSFVCFDESQPIKTLTVGGGGTHQVFVPPTWAHNGSYNGCAAFLDATDKKTIYSGQPLTLVAGGNPSWSVNYATFPSSTVVLNAGPHGGSALGCWGTLTDNWDSTVDVGHVIGLNLYGVDALDHTLNGNKGYVWPATKADSGFDNPVSSNYYGAASGIGMGTRLKLPDATDISGYPAIMQIIAKALKKYGAIVCDNTAWADTDFHLQYGLTDPNDTPANATAWQAMVHALVRVKTDATTGAWL